MELQKTTFWAGVYIFVLTLACIFAVLVDNFWWM